MATKLETARKTLGKQDLEELDKMSEADLKKRIVQASEAMREAHDKLEANEAYQRAKADASMLSQGKRDVNKRQNAFIAYCLHLLTEKGASDLGVVAPETAVEQSLNRLKKLGVTSISLTKAGGQ